MIESGLQLSEYQAKMTIFANIFAPFFATFGPDCGFKITVIEIFFIILGSQSLHSVPSGMYSIITLLKLCQITK